MVHGRTTPNRSILPTIPRPAETVLRLTNVDFVRGDRTILSDINWQVRRDDRWVVLGPNGSGKTTICRLASLYIHPSRGTIDVLGRRLGRTDVCEFRMHLGFTSAALANMFRPNLRVADIVVSGKHAALAPYWHTYSDADRDKARRLLERFGCEALVDAEFGTLSPGERQRVLLSRTLMGDPVLLSLGWADRRTGPGRPREPRRPALRTRNRHHVAGDDHGHSSRRRDPTRLHPCTLAPRRVGVGRGRARPDPDIGVSVGVFRLSATRGAP